MSPRRDNASMRTLLSLCLAALPALAAASRPLTRPPAPLFREDFSSYLPGRCAKEGSALGPWTVVFTGYGCARVEGAMAERRLHLDTRRSSRRRGLMALLMTGPRFAAPLVLRARLQTESRVGPETWKAAWLAWSYADRRHFYYFIPKEDGWELGKRDPAYPGGQRFLATGRTPAVPLGRWADVEVRQDEENLITVSLDGRVIARVRDRERPYPAGRIALYVEGAHAHFADVRAGRPGPGTKE